MVDKYFEGLCAVLHAPSNIIERRKNMTTKITDLTAAMMTNAAGMIGNVQNNSVAKSEEVSGFSDMFNKARTDSVDASASLGKSQSAADASKNAQDAMNRPSKEIKSDESVAKDPVNNEDDRKEFVSDVAKEVSKITDSVKEALDVTDEEIEAALSNLGLTSADLLVPQNVQSLCMELKGIEDSISLLTDAPLYENVKMLCNMASLASESITEEFGIDTDALSEMLNDDEMFADVLSTMKEMAENGAAATTLDFAPSMEETVGNDVNLSDDSANNVPATGDITSQNVTNEDAIEVVVTSDNSEDTTEIAIEEMASGTNEVSKEATSSVKAPVTEETRPVSNEEVRTDANVKSADDSETETFTSTAKSQEANLRGRNEGFENVSRFSETDNASAVNTTTVTQTEVNSVGDIVETVSHYTNPEGNEILSQVTQSIKVNYSADATSMEMQLHPASLGTVNMHISSTNGIVTAHILVENEAVKAALESQLITLQETFEAQGQKVEAVEVSIAGYDLNRNMGSETGNDSKGNDSRNFGRSGVRRRINLNDLTADDFEEMTEEEKISADMMARDGNSVDFKA